MFNEYLPSAEIEDKHNEDDSGHSRVSVQLPCHLIGEVEQLNCKIHKLPLLDDKPQSTAEVVEIIYTGWSVKILSRSGRGKEKEKWKTYYREKKVKWKDLYRGVIDCKVLI